MKPEKLKKLAGKILDRVRISKFALGNLWNLILKCEIFAKKTNKHHEYATENMSPFEKRN